MARTKSRAAAPRADGKAFLRAFRDRCEAMADGSRAAQMQAYMKSAMPYHGVPMPDVRRLCTELLRDVTFADAAAWEAAVRTVWTGATHREERYAALALAGHRAAKAFQTPEALPLYEFLVVDGAWWDVVDDVATHRLRAILDAHPAPVARAMRAWSCSEDLWKRRSAIVCQVGRKERTDRRLLEDAIRPALGEREFFLRKAIGWALRDLARVDPAWVLGYVDEHVDELSPLSRREALKHLGK